MINYKLYYKQHTLMSFSPLGVEVGLKTPYQIVRENESPALVCAVVDSPDNTNPSSVSFPFDIHFHFNGARDSASREYIYIIYVSSQWTNYLHLSIPS